MDDGRAWQWPMHADPVSQASLWVPYTLYPWQAKILRALTPGARVACVTPNESGKTSTVIPAAGLAFMAAFPGAQVVSTSGAERQIKEQLWPVLRACAAKYPQWQVFEDLKIKAPSVRGMPPSTWEAFTTNDPGYAEGFHGRWFKDQDGVKRYAPLMLIVDEAKSFDEKMMDAFKRCDADVWVMISTPGEDTGPFYDAFHVRRGKPWTCFEVGWTDCPHLRVGSALQRRLEEIQERGEDHPFVLSWIFGKFYRSGGRPLFEKIEDVEYCMSGLVRWKRGERRAALDFSGGGDESVGGVRDGNHCVEIDGFREKDATRVGDRFIKLFRKWELKPEEITADNGGLGAPIIDYLERMGWRGIRRYRSDAPARDSTRFVNKAAEDHFFVRDLVSRRLIGLPQDERLKEQMRKRQYVMRNDDSNRVRAEPKEKVRARGEDSPDRLDMTTMLFGEMPLPDEDHGPFGARNPRSACGDWRDCFGNGEEQEQESTIWGGSYFG